MQKSVVMKDSEEKREKEMGVTSIGGGLQRVTSFDLLVLLIFVIQGITG